MRYQVFIYFTKKQPTLEFQTDSWENVRLSVLDYKPEGYTGFVRNTDTNNTINFIEIV
jgi:hypothetical protein